MKGRAAKMQMSSIEKTRCRLANQLGVEELSSCLILISALSIDYLYIQMHIANSESMPCVEVDCLCLWQLYKEKKDYTELVFILPDEKEI